MKKVIGIYCGKCSNVSWDDTVVRNEGMGGSETWAVEMASEFQRRGFHVIVFGQPSYWHFADDGVEYVPWDLFEVRCEYQHFDYFISLRVAKEISNKISCDNIYIMSEDLLLLDVYNKDDMRMDIVKKIGVLSEYHKYYYLLYYPWTKENQYFMTFNGYRKEMYSDIPSEKKNQMVWSSCAERGLEFFMDNIFPIVKQAVSDFEVKICTYNVYERKYENVDGVTYCGKVGKEELTRMQKESKIWIYPNRGITDKELLFHETFCVTAIENAMAGNALVCLPSGGLKSVLSGYSGFVGRNLIENYYVPADNGQMYFDCVFNENGEKLSKLMADEAIKILTNDAYRKTLADNAASVCSKYTWTNAVDTWLKEWGLK